MTPITVVSNNEVAIEDEAALALRKRDREILTQRLPTDLDSTPVKTFALMGSQATWASKPTERLDPKEKPLWDLDLLRIPYLWSHYNCRGLGATVYVIDSGIDAKHPAFAGKTVFAKSFLTGVDDPCDETGHGTWVAGKIGAAGVGLAPQATLKCLRVLDSNGTGSSSFTNRALAAALADDDCDIVNLSLGSPTKCPEQEKLIWKLYRKGVLVVAAAGNRGSTAPFFPADFDGVLTIGATDRNQKRATFSNYGGSLELVAPGVSCYGPYLSGTYRKLEGTSMATPIVSGVLALAIGYLKRVKPSLDKVGRRDVLIEALKKSSKDLGSFGWDTEFGFGELDAVALLSFISR